MRLAFARCLGVALLALSQCTQARPEVQAASSAGREAGAGVSGAVVSEPEVAADSGVDAAAAGGAAGFAGGGEAGKRGEAGRESRTSAGSGAGGEGDDAGAAGAAVSGDAGCLRDIGGYAKAGPFTFKAETSGPLKLWVPQLPAGCKVPVVHMANGTGATCENYRASLERLASHGFLSVCFENTNTGSGKAGLEAFERALMLHPELADTKLGSAGHESGGQGAFATLQLAEVKWGDSLTAAGLAFAPASGNGALPDWRGAFELVKSPMLIVSGSADALVSEAWVQQSYEALADSVEAYLWSAVGAPHIPVPLDFIDQVSVAWFRWKLLGDPRACDYLKALPDGDDWDQRMQQNPKACH